MSLEIEGCSCVRCKAYLFSEDDIVYCPICGAPHHRECYNELGHCALEELHGTPEEYSRERVLEARLLAQENEKQTRDEPQAEQRVCTMCGEKYTSADRRCPKCGTPNVSQINGFSGFDFLGGVPADYKLSENATADDAKQFVMANTQRYVPKFATLSRLNKLSWNWMAFFFPCGWMLSRKMVSGGITAGLLSVIAAVLKIPLNNALYSLGVTDAANTADMMSRMTEALPKIGTAVLIVAAIGLVIDLAVRVIFALFGDYFYKKYAVSQIEKIKAESEDIAYDYRKKGGVSFWLFLLGTFAVNYLPAFIALLF